jgi:hypothetical protein
MSDITLTTNVTTVMRLAAACGHLPTLRALEEQLRNSDLDDLADRVEGVIERREEEAEQARVDGGDWSDNQRAFIAKAREMDLRVKMYSGRGMFGEECPAVSGDYLDPDDFSDAGVGVCIDTLGMGVVIYARS